jgi:hypothetical protein
MTTRWGGCVNGSQLKFSMRTLAYVPNSTQHASLLTRPGPHSYWTSIDPRNQVIELESQWNHESVQAKPQVELRQQKIEQKAFLTPHVHDQEPSMGAW